MPTERMTDRLRIDVDGRKYTVVQGADGGTVALRHGEEWLNVTMNPAGNLILALAQELEGARESLRLARQEAYGTPWVEVAARAEALRGENAALRARLRAIGRAATAAGETVAARLRRVRDLATGAPFAAAIRETGRETNPEGESP